MKPIPEREIIETIRASFPDAQAIYLFGSYGTEDEWPHSDADIAILLPYVQAKEVDFLRLSPLRVQLERILHRDVDLINIRRVSTLFQKEIIGADRRIYCADQYAADAFEITVIGMYQDLRIKRAACIADALETCRYIE